MEQDKDCWVATGDRQGAPCAVPLSFWWDGYNLYIATYKKNPTAININQSGRARIILGQTRDVVLIDAQGKELSEDEAQSQCAIQFASKSGWDPMKSKGYKFYSLTPQRVEAWRELNELPDRQLMSAGKWAV